MKQANLFPIEPIQNPYKTIKLIHQTHTKPQEIFDFKLIKPRETFPIKPPISLDLDFNWMVGFTKLEANNSILNITEKNNKFELYKDTFDEFSIADLKDELEEIFRISDFTLEHLQNEKVGPRILKAYHKLSKEKRHTYA